MSDPVAAMLSHPRALHKASCVHLFIHLFIQLPLSTQNSDTRLWAMCVPYAPGLVSPST